MRLRIKNKERLIKASKVGKSDFRVNLSANKEANVNLKYKGEAVYIGIDVHKKSYSIAVWHRGEIVKKARMPADPDGLARSLGEWFEGAILNTAYEAGFSGFVLHRKLVEHGFGNIVVNPASIEVAANDKTKTDKRDASKVATQLAAGRLRGIYVPSVDEELRRQATRTRDQLMKERNRIGNKIKSKLHYFGYITPNNDKKMSEKFIGWMISLKLPIELQRALDNFIEVWRLLNKQLEEIKVELQAQAFEDPESEEIYRSVPGVGLISARVLANELGDLSKRFKSQDSLYQYTGLTPSEYSSGEHIRKGHIDRQGSSRVRHILIEIAWRAIRLDKALEHCFLRIAYRRGKTRAIVAIARKLIGRIRACFVHQQPYELNLAA